MKSSFLAGAEMMTFCAPPSRWALALVGVGEEAGRLDDDVGAELLPGQRGRVALLEGADLAAADDDVLVVVAHVLRQPAEDAVVLEQVGQRLVVGQVVGAHDLDVGALRQRRRGRSCGRCGRSR